MRIHAIILSLLLAAVLLGHSQAESFWPMFQRDTGHTGVAPVSTPGELELLWWVNCSTSRSTHPVLGQDGTLWMVGGSVDRYSPTGENVLHITADGLGFIGEFSGSGSPAVLADGTLVAIAGVRNEQSEFVATLYAIEPDGAVRWTLPFDGQTNPNSLITLGPDGQIYVSCPTCVYSVSQEGSVAWSYSCDARVQTIPAVANDGSVYFGARNSTLYCLTPEGLLNWTFCPAGTAASIESAPTLDNNGHIYFAVPRNGFYCLNSDSSVQHRYPLTGHCSTSPILMADGSVAFYEMTREGTETTIEVKRLNADGTKRWSVALPTDQAPGCSPAADQDGNVFVTFYSSDARTSTNCLQFGRVDSEGNYTSIYSELSGHGYAGGPCIGADGTVFCQVGTKIMAYGRRQGCSIRIKTDSPGYAAWLALRVTVSISITNAAFAMPLDFYVALRRPDSDQLLFYPFWSPDPSLAALEFRPLPGDCFFENIEIAHIPMNQLPAGDYQLFAAFFEPGTFNLVGNINSWLFSVYGQVPTAKTPQPNTHDLLTGVEPNQIGTPPTISIWTDKDTYSAGEVLNLSLSLANQGLGMPFDLYIAAQLDDDPTGTLFFFPTWATSPGMTNISFLPLARGASLPSLTIMHLQLPDVLPRGGYKFLAAFFYIGTFNLASEIAEAHWTLM